MPVCPTCEFQAPAESVECPQCGTALSAPVPWSERPAVRRPVWVHMIVGAYVLLVGALTFGPVVAGFFSGNLGTFGATLLYAAVLSACGASLIAIPVRAARDLPNTQRSIWLPLLASATLAALLFLGFGFAAHEFAFGGKNAGAEENTALTAIWVALPLVWVGWAVLFGVMSLHLSPERFAGRVSKALLTGSALELLVAIPMHMVVRQRGYCCAGFGTGIGIGIGILVMLVALGPAVVFLFYRRYKQAYARRPRPE
ncbi:MAG: hypothetical protein FJ304_02610 [Planctomycetes bacterium]|nr:hypothetical protein [Planctomycetota bacterium]